MKNATYTMIRLFAEGPAPLDILNYDELLAVYHSDESDIARQYRDSCGMPSAIDAARKVKRISELLMSARKFRESGLIQSAKNKEDAADNVYASLPEFARW